VLYATEKFRNDNPKTYRAFVDALAEAADFATKQPEAAADLYIRVNKAKIDRALLVKILKNPQVQFKVTPQNTFPLAEFMHRVGAIKNAPKSWQDYFFPDPATAQGS
jgi:NitT/TauT family transport system substrate-binding protein